MNMRPSKELTSKVGVVNGDIATAGIIQNLELGPIRSRNICKILGIVGVNLLGVRLALLVSEVIPLGCSQGNL